MKTINILKEYAVNETNEAGVKGLVIWEEDFQEIADRIEGLGGESELKQSLYIAKHYFELALDRADPYMAIRDGLTRITQALDDLELPEPPKN